MWAPETEDIRFDSAMPGQTITGHLFYDAAKPPRAILQISHGMCEYIGRYADFAAYMVQNGFAVCGNEHLGHGAGCAPEDLGYFGGGDAGDWAGAGHTAARYAGGAGQERAGENCG